MPVHLTIYYDDDFNNYLGNFRNDVYSESGFFDKGAKECHVYKNVDPSNTTNLYSTHNKGLIFPLCFLKDFLEVCKVMSSRNYKLYFYQDDLLKHIMTIPELMNLLSVFTEQNDILYMPDCKEENIGKFTNVLTQPPTVESAVPLIVSQSFLPLASTSSSSSSSSFRGAAGLIPNQDRSASLATITSIEDKSFNISLTDFGMEVGFSYESYIWRFVALQDVALNYFTKLVQKHYNDETTIDSITIRLARGQDFLRDYLTKLSEASLNHIKPIKLNILGWEKQMNFSPRIAQLLIQERVVILPMAREAVFNSFLDSMQKEKCQLIWGDQDDYYTAVKKTHPEKAAYYQKKKKRASGQHKIIDPNTLLIETIPQWREYYKNKILFNEKKCVYLPEDFPVSFNVQKNEFNWSNDEVSQLKLELYLTCDGIKIYNNQDPSPITMLFFPIKLREKTQIDKCSQNFFKFFIKAHFNSETNISIKFGRRLENNTTSFGFYLNLISEVEFNKNNDQRLLCKLEQGQLPHLSKKDKQEELNQLLKSLSQEKIQIVDFSVNGDPRKRKEPEQLSEQAAKKRCVEKEPSESGRESQQTSIGLGRQGIFRSASKGNQERDSEEEESIEEISYGSEEEEYHSPVYHG